MDRITREEAEWLLEQHPMNECRGDCTQSRALIELIAYMDTGLTPDEITANMEMFAAYRHVCGGKSPEEVAQVFAENARLAKELQGAKANGMIQEHIISSGHNPADKDAIVRLTMNNAALTAETVRLRAERDKAVEEINLVFGRVRALADCDGYHPYENVCDLCAFFDGGEKRECHGNCKNARWRGTEGKA